MVRVHLGQGKAVDIQDAETVEERLGGDGKLLGFDCKSADGKAVAFFKVADLAGYEIDPKEPVAGRITF